MTYNSLLCTEKVRTLKPSVLGNRMFTPFQKYQMELDHNLRILNHKFPNEPIPKIKQLLEELDNDPLMVQELLQQQAPKLEPQNVPVNTNINHNNNLNLNEQQQILKKAVASLYKKLKLAQSKVKHLQEDNQKLLREKQFYKNRAKLLSSQQNTQQFYTNPNIF